MRSLLRLSILAAGLVPGAGAAFSPLHAQAPRPPAPLATPGIAVTEADTTLRARYAIPELPISEALAEFARQSEVQVRVEVGAANGVRSREVRGTMRPPEALRELLAGTGLSVRFEGSGLALISAVPDRVAYTLMPIQVVVQRTGGYAAFRTSSAMKTDTPLRDTPQSVSVVPHEVIADQSMRGMADVMRYVPGVAMGQGEGHRDAPTIRGQSTTADFFVDGMRDDAQYYRDLYNVERVEALKGSNAMIFGRGGGGGVVNRVTKEAQFLPTEAVTLQAGSYEHRRGTLDAGRGLSATVAGRVTGVYENSGGFREAASVERYGVNPTAALVLGGRTTLRGGYELFDDRRNVDRGVPSFQGRPLDVARERFFGNADISTSTFRLHAGSVELDHATVGGASIRNRTRLADYDKYYQNSYPGGAVNAAGTQVNLAAYSHAMDRWNLFNQTDLVTRLETGAVRHTVLLGLELGLQETSNYRRTGYYNDASTAFAVPVDAPRVTTPITFRQSASDPDNATRARIAGLYAQNQLTLSPKLEAVVGVRFDRFALDFTDHRTGEELDRTDDLVSPRAGLVYKPIRPVSLYGSYGVSHLPSSGDQFGSLTATTRTLEPERFRNLELGAKWDVLPNLALTAAGYRLDRTNTTAPDPVTPGRVVQTGEQRTTGFELGVAGRITTDWQILGAATLQEAEVVSATTAAPIGAKVPLVPERTFSLWNRYEVLPMLGVGLGILHQSEMFAAIDNSVTLPDFTRLDGALFLRIADRVSAQLNVENLLDEVYYPTSHGNNNIMPGAPRSLRLSVSTTY